MDNRYPICRACADGYEKEGHNQNPCVLTSVLVPQTTIDFATPDAAQFVYEINADGIMKGSVELDADAFFALGFSTGYPGVAPGPMSLMEYVIVGEERDGEFQVTIRYGTGERTRPIYSEDEIEARVFSYTGAFGGSSICSPTEYGWEHDWLAEEWCWDNCIDDAGALNPACDPEQGTHLCECISPTTSFAFEVDVNGFPANLLWAYTPDSREFTTHTHRAFHGTIDLGHTESPTAVPTSSPTVWDCPFEHLEACVWYCHPDLPISYPICIQECLDLCVWPDAEDTFKLEGALSSRTFE
jgi:hypothetical protein